MEIKPNSLLYKLIHFLGSSLINTFNRLVSVFTLNQDVINPEMIPFNSMIEEHLDIIYNEFLTIYHQGGLKDVKDFYKLQIDIGQNKDWKAFQFILYNYAFLKNMQRCPETTKLIQQIPGCTNAMFSLLYPGKHILPHKGVYKGVIRCLFTLKATEKGDCWIRVNDKKLPFITGKCIYFDETFEHEVMNDSDEIRIALYLDLYRKLPFPLNLYNGLIFSLLRRSPYIQNTIIEYNKIDKNEIKNHTPLPALNYM